ncbi:2-dehydropantoate 2-reductase [Alkalihalobacillus sp. FSL W8-0930]
MKIYIIGGGAIGLLVSAYLKKNNDAVTLCTRTKAQADQLNQKGLTLVRGDHSETIQLHSIQLDQANVEAADVCLFAVKSYDLDPILTNYFKRRGKHQSYLFLQNGMAHVETASELEEPTIAFATISHGAVRLDHTTVQHTGVGELNWAIYQERTTMLTQWLHSIQSLHFPVSEQGNWEDLLWSKLLVNACINPITALTGLKNGELIQSIELKRLMRSVFDEAFSLHPLQPDKEKYWSHVVSVCKRTAENTSSMLVDIKQERQTEVDAILGYLLRRAKAYGLSLPTISFLYQALNNREQSFLK